MIGKGVEQVYSSDSPCIFDTVNSLYNTLMDLWWKSDINLMHSVGILEAGLIDINQVI